MDDVYWRCVMDPGFRESIMGHEFKVYEFKETDKTDKELALRALAEKLSSENPQKRECIMRALKSFEDYRESRRPKGYIHLLQGHNVHFDSFIDDIIDEMENPRGYGYVTGYVTDAQLFTVMVCVCLRQMHTILCSWQNYNDYKLNKGTADERKAEEV